MKRISYLLISVFVLVVILVAPARTQTTRTVQLPYNLNVALCVNDWDRALNLVQQMLNSATITPESRSRLVTLYTQVEDYHAQNLRIDQSEACDAAIASGQGGSINFLDSERGSSSGGSSSDSPLADNGSASPVPFEACEPANRSTSGRCHSNPTAARRSSRSWEAGDRPADSFSQ